MKLGIIGAAGRRGTLAAYAAGVKGCFTEIKLYDDKANAARAIAMDMNQAMSLLSGGACGAAGTAAAGNASAAKAATKITAVDSISDMSDCKVILSVYSVNYQEIKDRKKELEMNFDLAKKACSEIRANCSDAVVMVSVNPVDTFVYVYRELLGFAPGKVLGVGASDTIRFKWALGEVTGKPAAAFEALCAGKTGHGIQLYGDIKLGGKPFSISEEQKKQVEDLCVGWFKDWAAQKAGLTADGTLASAFAAMAEAVALDSKLKMACSTTLAAELGYEKCAMNFDVILGRDGAKQIIEPKTGEDEAGFLKLFAGKIAESIDEVLA
ncbi:MAG: hypothetical protein Q4E57_06395 [Eubacteriales bacterium]|nr:hypothetical protein [Eubacteriales bacterium]